MNKRDTERALRKIEWAKEKCQKIIDNTTRKYCIKLRMSFNKIKKETLDHWYGDYHPREYSRTYGLYKIPKIEVDKQTGDITVRFDEENMTLWHRVSKEYIYDKMFAEGWHGGADKGPPDINGTPFPGDEEHLYWRTPGKPAPWGERYTKWGLPAKRTEPSPRDEIIANFQDSFNYLMEEMDKVQAEQIQKVFEEVTNFIINHS